MKIEWRLLICSVGYICVIWSWLHGGCAGLISHRESHFIPVFILHHISSLSVSLLCLLLFLNSSLCVWPVVMPLPVHSTSPSCYDMARKYHSQHTTASYVYYKIPAPLAVYCIILVFFPRLIGSKQMSDVSVQTHAGFYDSWRYDSIYIYIYIYIYMLLNDAWRPLTFNVVCHRPLDPLYWEF